MSPSVTIPSRRVESDTSRPREIPAPLMTAGVRWPSGAGETETSITSVRAAGGRASSRAAAAASCGAAMTTSWRSRERRRRAVRDGHDARTIHAGKGVQPVSGDDDVAARGVQRRRRRTGRAAKAAPLVGGSERVDGGNPAALHQVPLARRSRCHGVAAPSPAARRACCLRVAAPYPAARRPAPSRSAAGIDRVRTPLPSAT